MSAISTNTFFNLFSFFCQSQSSSTIDSGPNLLEMSAQGNKQSAEDFADFQAAAANGSLGSDFNPRAVGGKVQGNKH